MPKINDLNLKNWQEKIIELYGDRYKIRKTFDILDYFGVVYGYEVCDEASNFILHYDCKSLAELISYLKWRIYRNYESTYSYHK